MDDESVQDARDCMYVKSKSGVVFWGEGRKEGRVKLGLCATVLAPSSIADWMKLSGESGMEPFAHQSMLPASNTSSLFHRPFNFRG